MKKQMFSEQEWEKQAETLEVDFEYEIVTIIDCKDHIEADLTTNTKSMKIALNRFEKGITDIPLLNGFMNGFKEELKETGKIEEYTGREDMKNGCYQYSWTFEKIDSDLIYIAMKVLK